MDKPGDHILKIKREISIINGSLLKMKPSHLSDTFFAVCNQEHGLKLKVKLQHCGESEQNTQVTRALCSEC